MPHRMQKVDPFNDSEGPSTHHELHSARFYASDPKAVRVRNMASERHHSGMKKYGRDPLSESFGMVGKKGTYPRDHNLYSHSSSVSPRGAHYNPAGAFGHTARIGAGRGVYGYGGNQMSARPANAVPGGQNSRAGDNAVPGHQNSRAGENANMFPHISNRPGENAVGNPPNRHGENALAARFRPRFGKPHGHRV